MVYLKSQLKGSDFITDEEPILTKRNQEQPADKKQQKKKISSKNKYEKYKVETKRHKTATRV